MRFAREREERRSVYVCVCTFVFRLVPRPKFLSSILIAYNVQREKVSMYVCMCACAHV